MSLLVDQKINLEDSTGKRWAITVSEVDGSFAFKKGWDDFSSAHKLEIGDLLVFNCINKYNFDVKIYDQSMCERIDFSDKRKRKKRSRCSSGSLDAGGTPNSVEVVSENVNVDRSVKCPRTSEDTSYIRNHVYLNDAAIFNNDPMFEEVLGSGDTSYASKFGLLDRKDFFWSQVQDSQVTESLGTIIYTITLFLFCNGISLLKIVQDSQFLVIRVMISYSWFFIIFSLHWLIFRK